MSAIDNSEIASVTVEDAQSGVLDSVVKPSGTSRQVTMVKSDGDRKEVYSISKPSRVLHFSDGTLEEYDDSDEDDCNEDPILVAYTKELKQTSLVLASDPTSLSWPAWFHYYSSLGSHRTLNFLDRMGENIAYYLGITTPKYQYEIDEYYKVKAEAEAEQKEKNIELASWKPDSVRSSVDPITNQVSPVNFPA